MLLFGLFSVTAFASDDTNLIDSNMSNWGQFGANNATIRFLGNETNYIEASGSSHPILVYDLTEFLKIGESYRFSFTLPTTDGVNNSALNSAKLIWYITDGDETPTINAETVKLLEVNKDNKSKYLGKNVVYEFTYTQGFQNSFLLLDIEPLVSGTSYSYLQMYISSIKLERVESQEEGLLKNLLERIQIIINNIRDGFTGVTDSLTNGFNNLKNGLVELKNNIIELPQKIGLAIKNLFVPSEGYFEYLSNSFRGIAEQRFGALFTVVDFIDSFLFSFDADKTTEYIDIPVYQFDIFGYTFPFGGWRFRFIPDYPIIHDLVDIAKGVSNIIITFTFIGGLKSRYDEIFGGD